MVNASALIVSALIAAAQPTGPELERCPAGPVTCGPLGGAEQRRAQGLEDLSALAKKKVQIVRIFMQDGFGSRPPTISFVRRPGHEPTLEIATIAQDDGAPAIAVPIPLEAWLRVRGQVAYFDAPAPPPPPGVSIAPCVHPYSARIEVTDPAEPGAPLRERSAFQSQCPGGPTYAAAIQLAPQAKALIPSCALLNDNLFGGAPWALSFCAAMRGDKVAVAQARNVLGSPWLMNPRSADFAPFLQHHFYDFAEFRWMDEPTVKESARVAAAWADKLSRGSLRPKTWTGIDDGHVEIEGVIGDVGPPGFERTLPQFRLTMEKGNGFDFRIFKLVVTAPPESAAEDRQSSPKS